MPSSTHTEEQMSADANQNTNASGNAEHVIPIKTDTRTFEQREQDMLSTLKRNRKHKHQVTGQMVDKRERSEAILKRNDKPNWMEEMDKWIEETHNRWNEAIRRAHRNMFTLVPITPMDYEPCVPFGAFGRIGHLPSIMERMQRELDALDSYLENEVVGVPGALVSMPEPRERAACPFGYLSESYEMNDRGEVAFRVRFNVKGFHSDDLHVTTSKNRLTVSGKRSTRTDTSCIVSDFSRTIYLPDAVDHTRFECYLSKDDVLTLEAPVKCGNYESLGFSSGRQLCVRPQESDGTVALRPSGVIGVQLIGSEDDVKQKIHLEVPVEADFTADDLQVHADGNRVRVSGRKRVFGDDVGSGCEHVKQFSRSYVVPQTVDPLSLRAQLIDHTLVVEAPLLQHH